MTEDCTVELQPSKNSSLEVKYACLRRYFLDKRTVLAFTDSIGSSVLLAVARQVSPENVTAVALDAPYISRHELASARNVANELRADMETINLDLSEVPGFAGNGADRCLLCRKTLIAAIAKAYEGRYDAIVLDAHLDDLGECRHGERALAESGVARPLIDCMFSAADVRTLARRLGLSAAIGISSTCLAARVETGDEITADKLSRVEGLEDRLRELEFGIFRVRSEGDRARIEFGPNDLLAASSRKLNELIIVAAESAGFDDACVAPASFRLSGG